MSAVTPAARPPIADQDVPGQANKKSILKTIMERMGPPP
jgi:hypothetical protein